MRILNATFISSYKSLMYNKIINNRITKIYFLSSCLDKNDRLILHIR